MFLLQLVHLFKIRMQLSVLVLFLLLFKLNIFMYITISTTVEIILINTAFL